MRNSPLPDSPRNRQTDALQFPSALRGYSPFFLRNRQANVRTERNCKIRPGLIRTTDVSSRSPGALRRWRARISERQIFCGSSAIRCHPSGSLRFPLLLTRYPAVFRMQMRMDLLCTVLFRPVCGCNIYTSFPRSRPERTLHKRRPRRLSASHWHGHPSR